MASIESKKPKTYWESGAKNLDDSPDQVLLGRRMAHSQAEGKSVDVHSPPDVNQFVAFEEFKDKLDAEYGVMGPPRGVYCVPETKVTDFLKLLRDYAGQSGTENNYLEVKRAEEKLRQLALCE